MKKLFTITLIITSFFVANAQWEQLTDVMLEGGRVENFEQHGANLFMAAEGGIYISTDNGVSWSISMNGYSQHSTYINSLCSNSSGLYSYGSGLFYSTDGTSWMELNPVGFPANSHIEDFQEANNILYAKVIDDSNQDVYLYYSSNGINWTQGAYLGNQAMYFNCELFNFNDTRQYLQIDSTLLYTTDGISLDTINFTGITPPEHDFENSFCGEPNGNYLYYTDEDNTTVHRYNTTTEIWEDITGGLPVGIMMATGISAGDDAVFVTVLTAVPTLELSLYISVNNGNTWSLVSSSGLGSLPWLEEFLQIGTNEYIAQDPFYNIYYSSNNGSTWTKSQSGYLASRHSSLIEINGSLLSFKEQLGVIRSDNNGVSWSYSNGGLTPFLSDLIFVEDMYKFGNSLYISSQADPMAENYNLYKSTDNGLNWTILGTEPDSTDIVFCGQNADGFIIKLYSEEDDNYSYQLTLNDGGTWTNITAPIDALNLEQNYGFYGSSSNWYLFGVDGSWNNEAYMSTNNGVSWTDISTGLDNGDFQVIFNYWNDYQSRIPIDFNTSDQAIVVMNRWDMYPYYQQFYKFNGTSWDLITSTGLDSEMYTGTVLKNYSGDWYFATNEGVFVSVDECVTWQQVYANHIDLLAGIGKYTIQKINDFMFLGTMNNGIWMTDLSVDIDKLFANSDAIVYPNPANDILYIKNAENAHVRVLDISGREIMNLENVNKIIDVSGISEGIYIISIEQNSKIKNTKIIIQ